MVLAHFVEKYLPTSQNWVYPIIKGLQHTPTSVWTFDLAPTADRFPFNPIYSLKSLPPDVLDDEMRFRLRNGYWRYFTEAANLEGIRLIHAHFGNVGVTALPMKIQLGIPLVVSFYGHDLSGLLQCSEWVKNFDHLFNYGEAFVVEGNHAAECLSRLGCPKKKIHVVHLGINSGLFPYVPRRWNPRIPLRVLIVARLVKKKGTVYALQSLGLFKKRRPEIKLEITLVGDGPEREAVLAQIKKSGLTECMNAHASWDYTQYANALPKHHLLIQHSVTTEDGDHEGGAPVTLLEAQATGMPVLATFHADIPEYVIDQVSGKLTAERNIDQCADAIEELIDDHERWPHIGKAGHKHVNKNYNTGSQQKILNDIYSDLLSEPQKKIRKNLRYCVSSNIADVYRLAKYFFEQKDLNTSMRLYKKLVAMDPEHDQYRIRLAEIALARNQLRLCMKNLNFRRPSKEILDKRILLLSGAYAGKGEWARAKSTIAPLAFAPPASKNIGDKAKILLCRIACKLRDYPLFSDTLRELLNNPPDKRHLLIDIARLAFDYGKQPEKRLALQHLEKRNPDDPETYFFRGNLAFMEERYKDAVNILESDDLKQRTFSEKRLILCKAYFNLGNYKKTLELALASLEDEPEIFEPLIYAMAVVEKKGTSNSPQIKRVKEHLSRLESDQARRLAELSARSPQLKELADRFLDMADARRGR